nr:hypothetical protein [Tanacetum cinerariifolium]
MLAYDEGVDEVERCEDEDELRKKTFLEENIEKHIHLSTNNVYVSGHVGGTSGGKARPDGRDVRIEGTSGWKGHPNGRHIRMEGTYGGKVRPDGRDIQMKGTPH